MIDDELDQWSLFCEKLKGLRTRISSLGVDQVNSEETREQAKALVQEYFTNTKPSLVIQGVNTVPLDELMLILLAYANRRTLRKLYLELFKRMEDARRGMDQARIAQFANAAEGRGTGIRILQGIEARIVETLEQLLPLSAVSYKQVVLDLSDPNRVSFRGTAAEMREVLREVLDYLAPDAEVIGKPGFHIEKGCTRPTMKQKMHFVLDSRGKTRNALNTAVDATMVIDDTVGSFARSTYERASLSTHVSLPRDEVLQLKMYADAVLCELLEIHSRGSLISASSRS